MPARITLSKTPSLQDSVKAAHEALETGRTVTVGRRGNLEVTDVTEVRGGTFFGRAVRYLKNCFSPYRARRRNHAVIAALNEQISREFGPDHRLNIRTVLTQASTNERFLQSIISNVGKVRAGTEYTPENDTVEEAQNTLKFGFAGKVTAQPVLAALEQVLRSFDLGQTSSFEGESQTAREQLFWYNWTMNDLFNRFPKLRDIPAVSTVELDVLPGSDTTAARYDLDGQSVEIAPVDFELTSRVIANDTKSGLLTPKQDFSGLIQHEYAHHLSNKIVPEEVWVPKLINALSTGGMSEAQITYAGGKPVFDQETADKIANSVSKYAAKNARECAAEILSWYMNPEYGKSVKRMPDYLEHWVRECFPMLKPD